MADPFSAQLWQTAVALHGERRLAEAATAYDRLLAQDPDFVPAYGARGLVRLDLGAAAEALADFDRVLSGNPAHPAALKGRGLALAALGRCRDALATFDQALALGADNSELRTVQGQCLGRLGDGLGAVQSLSRAAELAPGLAATHYNLGKALEAIDALEDSLAAYDQALALDPALVEAAISRGVALHGLGRFEEALAAYDCALELRPDYAEVINNRAFTRLLLGDLARGWEELEQRKRLVEPLAVRPGLTAPEWAGEDLTGRTLFVHWEQGLGDTLQFCRYLPLLADRAAKVEFSCQEPLRRLVGKLDPRIEVIGPKDVPAGFDFHLPLMSAPLWLETRPDSIPGGLPYLIAEPERIALWRDRLVGPGFKVGIAWKGSPLGTQVGKAFPLAALAPLAALPGVRLISLQKGAGEEELAHLPAGMAVETLGPDFDAGEAAFLDTAAVMAGLDLVITTDTSTAHLAGALGVPTWVALKDVPDWRWLTGREDTPWYPSLTLYRQSRRGDWDGVFARMTERLGPMAARRG